jgi:hypothetical protein
MNFIYLVGTVVVLIVLNSLYKLLKNKKQIEENIELLNDMKQIEDISEVDFIDVKPVIEIPTEGTKVLGKNKWLYPTDEFGKLEKGTVV